MNNFWKLLIAANGAIGFVGIGQGGVIIPLINLTIFFWSLDDLLKDD